MTWILITTACAFAGGFCLGVGLTHRRRDREDAARWSRLDISPAIDRHAAKHRQVIPIFTQLREK